MMKSSRLFLLPANLPYCTLIFSFLSSVANAMQLKKSFYQRTKAEIIGYKQ